MLDTTKLPGRTLRVGIVGAHRPDPANVEHLRTEIDRLLREADHFAALDAEDSRSRKFVLSPLGEGTERLAAACALNIGYRLRVVLPFRTATFEEDFHGAASVQAFRDLRDQAEGRVLELDGSRADAARSYAACAATLVRNSDLLIAVWDGYPSPPGDMTESAVRLAAEAGPPVILLHPTQPHPGRWIESPHDLLAGATVWRAAERLPDYMRRLMRMPPVEEPSLGLVHGVVRRVWTAVVNSARFAVRLRPAHPVIGLLMEPERPPALPWRLWGDLIAGLGWLPFVGPRPPVDRIEAPTLPSDSDEWTLRFNHVRRQAIAFEARDGLAALIGFFALALSLAGTALRPALAHDPAAMIHAIQAEAGGAALLALMVLLDALLRWHGKAQSYRLITELCRVQEMLAPVGWMLGEATMRLSAGRERDADWRAPRIVPLVWESWLYAAWLRDTPLPTGTMTHDRVAIIRDALLYGPLRSLSHTLERDTIRLHQTATRLLAAGELCLLLGLGIAVARYELMSGDDLGNALDWMSTAAAILPAAGIAVLGFRAWTRLRQRAEAAAVMLRAVRQTRLRIAEMDCRTALSSQALGAALAGLGQSIVSGLPGWSRLARARFDVDDEPVDPLAAAERDREPPVVNAVDDRPDRPPAARGLPPGLKLEDIPEHRVPTGRPRDED